MNKLTLTASEVIALKQAHRACKDKRAADRIKAVYSLGIGFSVEDVVSILMLDEETLRNYVKRYQCTDHRSLLGFFFKTFSPPITGINSTSGTQHLSQQEQFLKQLEELRAKKGKNDPVLYMDGVHPQHNTMLAYGWIKKGQDNIIKSNTGRQRININGALDAESHAVIAREDERINAQSTIALLEQVEAAYPLAAIIYVICDNARYYRSKLVGQFLETSKIQLVFLPSYSPNLNLIERLWKFMKKQVLYNKYYEKFDVFKKTALGFFENIQLYKAELDSLLTNNFRVLNAE